MRRILAVAATGLVLIGVACTGPRSVDVAVSAGTARLAVGETLNVDMGAVNASIGDSWYVVGPPDPAVLTEQDQRNDADCGQPGCGGRLTWIFAAAGQGTTTIIFRYCYRSGPTSCQPQPDRGPSDPVALTVTVGAS